MFIVGLVYPTSSFFLDSSVMTSPPRRRRTSELFAPERRDLATRGLRSTESSPTLCVKVVTLPTEMGLEENPSTGRSLLMKTSNLSTLDQV